MSEPSAVTDLKTSRAVRKPFEVEFIQVTEDNIELVAHWCKGKLSRTRKGDEYIKVQVQNPLSDRQTKAFARDYVLYAHKGFKVYTPKAFEGSFDQILQEI